ncbi:hypothetical protein HDF22_005681 [Mucilaginibacter lappiensis]|uniref:Uncharacterized protein n=1 Tax=Mucilaginibacter lappiensis TaxID=354630 RepID=A0A841JKK0_9SPHI|nr:hypothetical protein [Mucilaginibacter lappiensis]
MNAPYCTLSKSPVDPHRKIIVNSKHPILIEVFESGEDFINNKVELSYYVDVDGGPLTFQTIYYNSEYRDIIELSILWYVSVNFDKPDIKLQQLSAA